MSSTTPKQCPFCKDPVSVDKDGKEFRTCLKCVQRCDCGKGIRGKHTKGPLVGQYFPKCAKCTFGADFKPKDKAVKAVKAVKAIKADSDLEIDE